MDTRTRAALTELLDRAGASQAAFARLSGVSARQVNSWCRGRAAAPRWALVVAALLAERSPEDLALTLEEALAAFTMPRARLAHGERPAIADAPADGSADGRH